MELIRNTFRVFSRCLSDSIRGSVRRYEDPSRENFDDTKSTEKRISDHRSSCLASIKPPPTHILPLPTRITAPAHQQRLRIGRVSGLVRVMIHFSVTRTGPSDRSDRTTKKRAISKNFLTSFVFSRNPPPERSFNTS